MKINPNIIKVTPKNQPFNFCIWGKPTAEIQAWIDHWELKTEESAQFTNIIIGETDINQLFEDPKVFDWIDGFSPNLNKHLHLGHLTNLVIAKAFQNLGISKQFVSLLGDTLEGKVEHDEALVKFHEFCGYADFKVDRILFASEQKATKSLVDGEGEYEGTKVFDINGKKIVGVKSSGSTTYFYQDVALAEYLDAPTLYITGFEQSEHFGILKELFPQIQHLGIGLVMINGKKMSSSEGNVIMGDEVLSIIEAKFENNQNLAWNVFTGMILRYDPKSVKNIDLNGINDVKASPGLYLSYTLAKMKSAGMVPNEINGFISNELKFKLIKAKSNLTPNILFEEVIELAKKISHLYVTHHIKDNVENQQMFQPMLDDLLYGMKILGMRDINKV